MTYQNVSAENGRSKFVKVQPNGALDELFFTGKRSNVPLGNGYRANTAASGITLVRQHNVAGAGETPIYLSNSVKLTYNIVAGDSTAFDELEVEVLRVMAIARTQYQLDNGLVPPTAATFPKV